MVHKTGAWVSEISVNGSILRWRQQVVLCRSCPRIVLVNSDANDWSGRMQMDGQVCAITHILKAVGKQLFGDRSTDVAMVLATSPIAQQGVATLLDEVWALARHQTEIIGPLAALEVVGHKAADAAAQSLGVSRQQVYVLIRRARQGTGLVTDLAPGRSGGGKAKGRLPEPVERIIRELLQKRSLTKQKRSLAAFHREVAQACKAQKLRVPARNTVALSGSPTSTRSRPLAAEKVRMRLAACKLPAVCLPP